MGPTSIGPFHFDVTVDIGDASGIGGSADIAISDVQLLSGFVAPVATVDLGVASGISKSAAIVIPDVPLPSDLVVFDTAVDLGVVSGIGGSAAIVIPDVPLPSGFATLPSPSISGVRPASAGMLSRCPAAIAVCRLCSMQHLFNRSRSRPSWVMQGSAPRAR